MCTDALTSEVNSPLITSNPRNITVNRQTSLPHFYQANILPNFDRDTTPASEFILSNYADILNLDVQNIMDAGSKIAFPIFQEQILIDLCLETIRKLSLTSIVSHTTSPVILVGDIHGSIHDLLRIFKDNGNPYRTNYLFLGDFVDRGQFSLEVITLLFAFVCTSSNILLLRGNHEVYDMCSLYGFKQEIVNTYGSVKVFDYFIKAFDYLSFAAIIDETKFCVHGGISAEFTSIESLNKIQKPVSVDDYKQNQLLRDLLWADPSKQFPCFHESLRGDCSTFGSESIKQFLAKTKFTVLFRGHECCTNGVKTDFNSSVITVFSASSYKSNGSNKSGIIYVFQNENKIKIYSPLPRPNRNTSLLFQVRRPSKIPRTTSITLKLGNMGSPNLLKRKRNTIIKPLGLPRIFSVSSFSPFMLSNEENEKVGI